MNVHKCRISLLPFILPFIPSKVDAFHYQVQLRTTEYISRDNRLLLSNAAAHSSLVAHQSRYLQHYDNKINRHMLAQYSCFSRDLLLTRMRKFDDNNNEQRNDGNDTRDVVIDFIDNLIDISLTPLSFFGNISVGIAVFLLFPLILQPLPQGALTLILFAIFSTIGKKFILVEQADDSILDDDNSNKNTEMMNEDGPFPIQIEFFALAFSFFAATLLSPDVAPTAENINGFDNFFVPFVLLLLSVLVTGIYNVVKGIDSEDILSPDERLLNRWDMKFRIAQKQRKKSEDDKKK
jgi:hypothetical protein